MMNYYASDYRRMARNALAGNWGTAIGVSVVAVLIIGAANGLASIFIAIVPFIALLFNVAALLLTGPINLGTCRYYTMLARGENPSFGELFSRFSLFGKALGLYLVMSLFTFLWSLLFCDSGNYRFLPVFDGAVLAGGISGNGYYGGDGPFKQMMAGYKGRLFCLQFSFFGWALLCVLTLGIGFLWLNSYMYTAQAAFFPEPFGMDAAGWRLSGQLWTAAERVSIPAAAAGTPPYGQYPRHRGGAPNTYNQAQNGYQYPPQPGGTPPYGQYPPQGGAPNT